MCKQCYSATEPPPRLELPLTTPSIGLRCPFSGDFAASVFPKRGSNQSVVRFSSYLQPTLVWIGRTVVWFDRVDAREFARFASALSVRFGMGWKAAGNSNPKGVV